MTRRWVYPNLLCTHGVLNHVLYSHIRDIISFDKPGVIDLTIITAATTAIVVISTVISSSTVSAASAAVVVVVLHVVCLLELSVELSLLTLQIHELLADRACDLLRKANLLLVNVVDTLLLSRHNY